MLFYLFGFVVLLTTIISLFLRNILHFIFGVMLIFLGIASVFVLLGADFLAVSQIIIYVGGILVLLTFGLMLSYPVRDISQKNLLPTAPLQSLGSGLALSLLLLGMLSKFILDYACQNNVIHKENQKITTIYLIGTQFLTTHLMAFETIALLLLIALVGAVLIAKDV
ncbi:MAG: NADH-quinone oxidoreductase subunit J [Microscillaceae bacterium]|nr:NADH-quinone oxidoreductase subunit J [Microscillaceae bacterium]MDW8461244.1 NADH-quinone oxidoreductase subunit J [Cytophagales bacterium]